MKIPRFIRHSWSYNGMKTTNLGKKYLIHSGKVIPNKEVDSHLAAAPVLKMKEYANKPLVGIVKDGVHFDGYVSVIASWFYYERFLKVNDIPYRFYDIYAHDWLEQAKQFDIIIWRTESTPEEMYIAESKIYICIKSASLLFMKCGNMRIKTGQLFYMRLWIYRVFRQLFPIQKKML